MSSKTNASWICAWYFTTLLIWEKYIEYLKTNPQKNRFIIGSYYVYLRTEKISKRPYIYIFYTKIPFHTHIHTVFVNVLRNPKPTHHLVVNFSQLKIHSSKMFECIIKKIYYSIIILSTVRVKQETLIRIANINLVFSLWNICWENIRISEIVWSISISKRVLCIFTKVWFSLWGYI